MSRSQWSGWEALGRPAGTEAAGEGVAAVALPGAQAAVFSRGLDGHIYGKRWTGCGWRPGPTTWRDLGGPLTTDPAALSWNGGRVDIFALAPDGAAAHRSWQPDTGWWPPLSEPWEVLGGHFRGVPTAETSGPDRLDLFACDHAGILHQRCWQPATGWDGAGGPAWRPVAALVNETPAVVSWGPDRLDIFIRSASGELCHKWWDDDPDRFGIFTSGGTETPHVDHQWWDPGIGWLPFQLDHWEMLGGKLTTVPVVVSWEPSHLDIFARGADGHLYHKWWDPDTSWQPAITDPSEHMGGVLATRPTVSCLGQGRLEVFARAVDNTISHKFCEPDAGWCPSVTDWLTIGTKVPDEFVGTPTSLVIPGGPIALFSYRSDGQLYYNLSYPV